MKTKNKILAMVEIVIVLCSVFLMAIPAIATQGQNQEMQKVSASTITTTSEDDYILGVYGNANEDDTIDMGDVVYTKLAIFGKKPKTELCDAKYDGRINVLDVIQTKLIILGKEKELTIIDHFGDAVTIRKPVERIIVIRSEGAEVLRVLDATDKIVGVGTGMGKDKRYFPELSELPSIGGWRSDLDYEAILNLNPDVLITTGSAPKRYSKEKLSGIAIFWPDINSPERFKYGLRELGYIIDKEEEADKYINWHEGYWTNTIKERTEGLPEDKKPKVYLEMSPGGQAYRSAGKTTRYHQMCVIAGGKNIVEDLEGHWITVDPEWVIVQNPDIIVVQVRSGSVAGGYGVDDPSGMATLREDIMNRPELANVNAVKTGKVYMLMGDLSNGPRCLVCSAYMAKWFHPDIFKGIDPKAIHQEYVTRFCGLDYDLDEHGVFVYHPEEHPDGH